MNIELTEKEVQIILHSLEATFTCIEELADKHQRMADKDEDHTARILEIMDRETLRDIKTIQNKLEGP